MVLAGMLGPLGRSKDEHLCKPYVRLARSKKFWLTVGSGGLFGLDLIEVVGLLGGKVLLLLSVGVIDVTGLTGCERLCSGAWNVYTVRGGL